jgi:putative multicomponent Na+:H+ antiporter subunit B
MTEAMTEWDVGLIVLLLPLAAAMVVFQDNPYHALVVRGILGAIAALVYALFGAADVALTEALMGTMLGTALCVVAVRSSLVLRLGVLATEVAEPTPEFVALCDELRLGIAPYHLRLEVVPYDDRAALKTALVDRDVHGICTRSRGTRDYKTVLRVARPYEILRGAIASPLVKLTYVKNPETVVLTDAVAHSRVDSDLSGPSADSTFDLGADSAANAFDSTADQSEGMVPQEPHR